MVNEGTRCRRLRFLIGSRERVHCLCLVISDCVSELTDRFEAMRRGKRYKSELPFPCVKVARQIGQCMQSSCSVRRAFHA